MVRKILVFAYFSLLSASQDLTIQGRIEILNRDFNTLMSIHEEQKDFFGPVYPLFLPARITSLERLLKQLTDLPSDNSDTLALASNLARVLSLFTHQKIEFEQRAAEHFKNAEAFLKQQEDNAAKKKIRTEMNVLKHAITSSKSQVPEDQ